MVTNLLCGHVVTALMTPDTWDNVDSSTDEQVYVFGWVSLITQSQWNVVKFKMCASASRDSVLFKLGQQVVFAHRSTYYNSLCSEDWDMVRKCMLFLQKWKMWNPGRSFHELQAYEDCGCLLSLGLLIYTAVNSAGTNLFMLFPAIIKYRVVCFSLFTAIPDLHEWKSPSLPYYIIVPLT